MRGLIRKSVIFFENMDDDHSPQVASPIPPAMVEFGRFGTLADGRPIRLGGRAFDVLMALIEASRAVVSKHELLGRVWQGRIVGREPVAEHEIAALRKGFSAVYEAVSEDRTIRTVMPAARPTASQG